MATFSNRHRRALASGELTVDLSGRLRTRLWRLMGRCNESFSVQRDPNDGWTETTDFLSELQTDLLDAYGINGLVVEDPDGIGHDADFAWWFDAGPAAGALDAVEGFLGYVDEGNRAAFAASVNDVMVEEDSSWRLLDGEFILLDSVFVHDRLVSGSQAALHSVRFSGAAQEMLSAENDLVDGDGRGAIHNAGSAFESTMKAALERDDVTPKQLTDALVEVGFLDGLPEKHRDGFVTNVLMALPWMRNRLGGHGQGRDHQPVPAPYARLAIGLAAVLNEFVVALAIERDSSLVVEEAKPSADEDLVFVPFSATDDDIPF